MISMVFRSLIKFQSAPLTDVRGDRRHGTYSTTYSTFQSAPLTDVRGDALDEHAYANQSTVSIRSPH